MTATATTELPTTATALRALAKELGLKGLSTAKKDALVPTITEELERTLPAEGAGPGIAPFLSGGPSPRTPTLRWSLRGAMVALGRSRLVDLGWAGVCGRRLVRHGLTPGSGLHDPAGAAAAMCGAHAQVLSAAELSIGLRVADVTRASAQEALVKTFGPRGTVHLLAAKDLALWCGALSAIPPLNQRPPGMRLTPDQTDELVAAIEEILAGAELTVDELTAALAERVGPWAVDLVMPAFQTMWPRWRQVTVLAAHRGVLCFGANKGRSVTYTNPGLTPAPAEEATHWLLDSYLRSYGPATPQHFARWLAAPPGWARDLFEAHDLTEVSVEGARTWVAAGDDEPGEPARGVLLLPHFDAFVVGSQPRELLFPGAAWDRALARGQAGNFPVLVIDGVVAGVWHQKKSTSKVAITVEPLRALTSRERKGLDARVERVGEILQVRPDLTVGPISVGAHA
ncbi:DNA glycosylase AlkZ-like family protein [Actinoplanes sp. CA-142083]|uniref:DNA glycosylase AlkZ-like family protein n=1 Tax=Actinoplanes sp. CA-142083 TaxID=3239903 RepID=UPI003D92098A